MLSTFFHKLQIAVTDPVIRLRILFILGAFAVFRFLAAIPIPGVDRNALESFFSNNQFFGLLNVFSGGGFSKLSLVMLGVAPYITGSIIMQLATILFPNVKRMYTEEGEAGRAKFIEWSRIITIPIAIIQAVAFLSLLQSQGVLGQLDPIVFVSDIMLVSAGSLLLMWIGELMTEFGIGNGVSLLIFAGIASRVPSGISQLAFTFTTASIPAYLAFAAMGVAIVYAVVVVSEAERSIPIAYARAVRGAANAQGAATYLPIRLLQTGVIPIVFALSLLLFPQMVLNGLGVLGFHWAATWALHYTAFTTNSFEYGAAYFILVVIFTYFYTSITFEPHRVAENLQKSGAFVPGVRPGPETERYIGAVVNRITLPGAVFLGLLAVIPFIVEGLTGVTAILVGGTALLIAVQVILDLIRKVDAQVSLREY